MSLPLSCRGNRSTSFSKSRTPFPLNGGFPMTRSNVPSTTPIVGCSINPLKR